MSWHCVLIRHCVESDILLPLETGVRCAGLHLHLNSGGNLNYSRAGIQFVINFLWFHLCQRKLSTHGRQLMFGL